jgi:hypothetical protein
MKGIFFSSCSFAVRGKRLAREISLLRLNGDSAPLTFIIEMPYPWHSLTAREQNLVLVQEQSLAGLPYESPWIKELPCRYLKPMLSFIMNDIADGVFTWGNEDALLFRHLIGREACDINSFLSPAEVAQIKTIWTEPCKMHLRIGYSPNECSLRRVRVIQEVLRIAPNLLSRIESQEMDWETSLSKMNDVDEVAMLEQEWSTFITSMSGVQEVPAALQT